MILAPRTRSRHLRLPLRRQRPLQTIRDQEPTLGHRKKLPAGKSETSSHTRWSISPKHPDGGGRPQGEGDLDRGLAFSQGIWGGRWSAAHDYTRSGIPFQPSKRGAEGRWVCAPTPRRRQKRRHRVSLVFTTGRIGPTRRQPRWAIVRPVALRSKRADIRVYARATLICFRFHLQFR
jgi:hypothetical protein